MSIHAHAYMPPWSCLGKCRGHLLSEPCRWCFYLCQTHPCHASLELCKPTAAHTPSYSTASAAQPQGISHRKSVLWTSDWSAEHSWARCTWNWCVARTRDGKVVHVGLCFAVSSWPWRGLGERWGSSMEELLRSCCMGAHVARTGEYWRVMGQVEFGLWSVQAAEMLDFNLEMCCCPVSNALCFVFQLFYSCRMVMLAGTVFCLWGIFHVWTVEHMEGILTEMESMHMGVHQGAWMLNSLPFKCTLVQTNLLSDG